MRAHVQFRCIDIVWLYYSLCAGQTTVTNGLTQVGFPLPRFGHDGSATYESACKVSHPTCLRFLSTTAGSYNHELGLNFVVKGLGGHTCLEALTCAG